MEQPLWSDHDPVDFPSETAITSRAFELFFRERAAPQPFQEYRRRAETELLERAFQQMLLRAQLRGRSKRKR